MKQEKLPFDNHRNEIERQIIVLLVEDLLSAGFAISVNNGEENVLNRSTKMDKIFSAMSTTDEEYLMLHSPRNGAGNRSEAGWVRLVYGNDGDVISDYTTNIPESVFERANALSDRFNRVVR
jgi:hypothetical protein